MLDIAYLKQLFNAKLAETGSFDDAFVKAVWIAFKLGYECAKAGGDMKALMDKINPHK
jgi:hypothetical protein